MVVYLDLAFLLNALADGLSLYITARVAGMHIRIRKLVLAALLGGLYGAVCLLPGLGVLGDFFPQMAAAAGLVFLTFGSGREFLRRFLLFYIVSCTMSGVLLSVVQILVSISDGKTLETLNWKAFLLVVILCYMLLSVVFRGGARHALAGQLCSAVIRREDCAVELTVLLDTGHTLTDGMGGRPVLVVELSALRKLWSDAEWMELSRLPELGASNCLARLGPVAPGVFRLLPYRAVGVSSGVLLCFRADQLILESSDCGPVTIAVSPGAVSDGGGYSALWGGGKKKGEERHAA